MVRQRSSLGLQRGTVRLHPPTSAWRRAFLRERKRLTDALPTALAIEHIGSTAVPGIAAKPIIDISIGFRTLREAGRQRSRLEAIGYECRPVPHGQYLFAKGPERRRTHYVHLMKYRGVLWRNDLLFRDLLRTNGHLRKKYETRKRRLAARFPQDRRSYTQGKADFILRVLKTRL